MKRYKLLFLACALALAVSAPITARAASDMTEFLNARIDLDEKLQLQVDGREVSSDVSPVVVDEKLMVPLRFVAQSLGMEVGWEPSRREVYLRKNGREMILEIGNHRVWDGSKWVEMRLAPVIFRGRAMVPYEAFDVAALIRNNRPAGGPRLPFENTAMAAEPQDQPDSGPAAEVKKLESESGLLPESFKIIRWVVYVIWAFGFIMLITRKVSRQSSIVDVVALILLVVAAPLCYFLLKSTYFTASVPIVAAIMGLLSREDIESALVSIADSSQVMGLLGTLVGLGPIIGPAIATKDVYHIGYGLAVVIETTIVGIIIALVTNAIRSRLKFPEE